MLVLNIHKIKHYLPLFFPIQTGKHWGLQLEQIQQETTLYLVQPRSNKRKKYCHNSDDYFFLQSYTKASNDAGLAFSFPASHCKTSCKNSYLIVGAQFLAISCEGQQATGSINQATNLQPIIVPSLSRAQALSCAHHIAVAAFYTECQKINLFMNGVQNFCNKLRATLHGCRHTGPCGRKQYGSHPNHCQNSMKHGHHN